MHDTDEGSDTQATPKTHDIGQGSDIQTWTKETGLEAQAKLETFSTLDLIQVRLHNDESLESHPWNKGVPLGSGRSTFSVVPLPNGNTRLNCFSLALARLYIEPPCTFQCLGDRGGPSLSRFLHTISSATLLCWRLSDGLVAHPLS